MSDSSGQTNIECPRCGEWLRELCSHVYETKILIDVQCKECMFVTQILIEDKEKTQEVYDELLPFERIRYHSSSTRVKENE